MKFSSKKLFPVFLALCISLFFVVASAEPVRVTALKGPTAMGMIQMMENPGEREFSIVAAVAGTTGKM